MCGIVGFAGKAPLLDARRLSAMSAALAHRGPDAHGLRLWNAAGHDAADGEPGCVGLAHRRLSVIDLSPAANQPACNEDGTLWISYNGEFYNFEAGRTELERQGHQFRSRSDTETILHLYESCGIEETLRRMNGMFAFGLWDGRRRTLILARDRIGKKPLYYTVTPDGALLFASEIKALLASGRVPREPIDLAAFMQFWTFGYTVGERTLYPAIRRLLPGHFAVWKDGALSVSRYWDCPFNPEPSGRRSLDDLADELESLLCDAIRLRLIADVPLGLFLSGGVDSSLIAALTVKVAGRDLRAFTIAFPQQEFNEAPYALQVARHLGIRTTVLSVEEDLRAACGQIAAQFDEPFGDSSAVPTFFLSKLARRHVTVALTGDGGDELFAGYDSYADGLRLWGDRSQRRVFAKPRRGMERVWDLKRRLTPPGARLTAWGRLMAGRQRRRLFAPAFLRQIRGIDVAAERARWYLPAAQSDLLSRMQYVDVKTYLPDDILVKVDRMSMAHALECRSPLLDYRIAEFAARLPYEARFDASGRGKNLLRKVLSRHLPPALFERPKQGFAVPWAQWCQGDFGRGLRARWQRLRCPYFAAGSGEFLFPADHPGPSRLQWNAFAALPYLEGRP